MSHDISIFNIFSLNEDVAMDTCIDLDIEISQNHFDNLIAISKRLYEKGELIPFDEEIVNNIFFDDYIRKYNFTEAVYKLGLLRHISVCLSTNFCRESQIDEELNLRDPVTYEIIHNDDDVISLGGFLYLTNTIKQIIIRWLIDNKLKHGWREFYRQNPLQDPNRILNIPEPLIEKYYNELNDRDEILLESDSDSDESQIISGIPSLHSTPHESEDELSDFSIDIN